MGVRLLFLLGLQIALCGVVIAQEKANVTHAGNARVGVLWPSAFSLERYRTDLESALREVGYAPSQNLILEHRVAVKRDQLRELAADLVSIRCDVIIAIGTPAAVSLKRRTSEVPVVFFDVGDPVAAELVQDLSKPGGNLTGFASLGPELSVKLVELAKEALPTLSRVGVIWDRGNPANARQVEELVRAASSFKLGVYPAGIQDDSDFTRAFGIMRKRHVGAVLVLRSSTNIANARHIGSLAAAQRVPAISAFPQLVEEGGLIAYYPSYGEMWAGVARYVSQILNGAWPATLPVQQPTRFELLLNVKAATALGVTVPDSLRLRADRVIE